MKPNQIGTLTEDEICRNSENRLARFAACDVTGREFPGRCQAYRFLSDAASDGIAESFVTRALRSCEAQERELIRQLRSNDLPLRVFYGWSLNPEHRRDAMRVYASAIDLEFRDAAREIAATMLEARDIPECPVSGPR